MKKRLRQGARKISTIGSRSLSKQAGEGWMVRQDKIEQDAEGNPCLEYVALKCFFYLTDISSDLRELRLAAKYID
jgi:hypothetical protein